MRVLVGITVLATAFATGQVCGAQCSEPTEGAKSVLAIAAYPLRGKVKSGSSVLLIVSMTNKSRHDVSVWMNKGGGENQYEVDVRDAKRNLPADTPFGERRNGHVHLEMLNLQELIASGTCVTLKSKKSITHLLDVSKLYELNAPGKYFIRVQTADPQTIAMVKSNTVKVTVAQ
jgi:hypothetical protein